MYYVRILLLVSNCVENTPIVTKGPIVLFVIQFAVSSRCLRYSIETLKAKI